MNRLITICTLVLFAAAEPTFATCTDLFETVAAPLTEAPSTAKGELDTRQPELAAKAAEKEPDTAPPKLGPNGTEIRQVPPSKKSSIAPEPKKATKKPYTNLELLVELRSRGYEFLPTGAGFNIGRGGMGAVFLSSRINPETGESQLIALKAATTDQNAIGLYQEARTLEILNAAEANEKIKYFPIVYNADQVERIETLNGDHQLVETGLWKPVNPALEMEFVRRNAQFPRKPAFTLLDAISNHVDYRDDPKKPPLTESVVWHIEEAMARAHSQGLVHLDLKPDNIGIRENGVPVIFDHGLASNYEQGSGSSGGTFGWMGEAQFHGKRTRPKDDVDNIAKLHAAIKIAQNPQLRAKFTYVRPKSDRVAVKHALETPDMTEGQRLVEMADWSRLARTVEERRAFRFAARNVANSKRARQYQAKKYSFLKRYGERLSDEKNFDTDIADYPQLLAKELLGSKTAIDHIHPKSGLQLSEKTIQAAIDGANSLLTIDSGRAHTERGKMLRKAWLNDEVFSPYLHYDHFADHVKKLHKNGEIQLSENDLNKLESIKTNAARVRELIGWIPPAEDPGVVVLGNTSD